MPYAIVALLVLANGLLIACLVGIRQAAQARSASLAATVDHLEHVADLLDAISRPPQRLGTPSQQPGDGIRSLRERIAIRRGQ